jgi:hypothetical protein
MLLSQIGKCPCTAIFVVIVVISSIVTAVAAEKAGIKEGS